MEYSGKNLVGNTPILALNDNPAIAPLYELAPGMRWLVVARGALLVRIRQSTNTEVLHSRRCKRRPVSAQELELY